MIIWQSAACLIRYYFLNLDKSLHLRSIFSKLMRCTKNCNACIQHWPTERAKFFFTTTPDLTPHCKTNAWKVEQTGLWSFALSTIVIWPIANWLPIIQTSHQLFVGKMLPQWTRGRKSLPRVCQIPRHIFLCYRNKQTLLIGKKLLIVMVPILISKDVLEPSYNDLKFMVWNHNYICTSLIAFVCPSKAFHSIFSWGERRLRKLVYSKLYNCSKSWLFWSVLETLSNWKRYQWSGVE